MVNWESMESVYQIVAGGKIMARGKASRDVRTISIQSGEQTGSRQFFRPRSPVGGAQALPAAPKATGSVAEVWLPVPR